VPTILPEGALLVPLEPNARSPLSEAMVVVFSDYPTNRVFLMNYENKPMKPSLFPMTTILSWIETELITTAEMKLESLHYLADSQIKNKTINKRDKRFNAIYPVIENLEEFLLSTYDSKLVAEAARQVGVTRYQIYQWTYLYLRRGQTKNALLPTYQGSSGKGRKSTGARLGRPPRSPGHPYKLKTPQDERNLKRVLEKHYFIPGAPPLRDAWLEFLALHYSAERYLLPNGKIEFQLPQGEKNYPSLSQFKSWKDTLVKKTRINPDRLRMSKSNYDKDLKGRSGDFVRPSGPGETYQIDATVTDVYVISQFDKFRNLIVGRPTLYSVVDVFSEAIVGILLTLAPPSWHGMALALFNAFRPKVSFCEEVGFKLTDERAWPMAVPCIKLFGDNAELNSELSESLHPDLGVTVLFGRPYRGDDKGLVEKSFDHFNKKIISRLPGFVSKESNSRGVKDPKLSAAITLPEFYDRLIDYIIHHNNIQECSPQLLNKQMVADGVPPRRRDIWNWGMKNRPFTGRALPEELLYLHLLEKGEASVHREGVYFRKLLYVCDWTLANGLQNQQPNRNRAKKFDVRFMRHSTEHIYLCTPEGLKLATLKSSFNRFEGCDVDEVESQLSREHNEKVMRSAEVLSSELSLNANTRNLVKTAQATQVKLTTAEIKKQLLTENRQFEIEQEQLRERERLRNATSSIFGLSEEQEPESKGENQTLQQESKRNTAHQDAMNNLFGSTDDNDS